MKITRTINGQNITIELTAKELSDAWWEETINDLQREADYAFDCNLSKDMAYPGETPRINNEPGDIPGSEAYRDAFRETFVDSYYMWEDHAWEDYMRIHPMAQFREMTLSDMLPYVKETEKWLEAHPAADKETIRKAVMAEFRKHINGDSPMDDVSAICERAYEANA